MKNIETPDKRHLASIISNLREGAYAIPDFQRDFEWKPSDVNELIRSIFEDYYIGTLLLWRATKDNLTFLKCQPINGFIGEPKFQDIVLDGQQRLSALYYALFAPDKNYPRRKSRYLFFVKLEMLLEDNFEEAFVYDYGRSANSLLMDEKKQFLTKTFPLKILGDDQLAWYQWLERYEKFWKEKGKGEVTTQKDKLVSLFTELINQYYVSHIELDRNIEVEKVCDIFTRLNNTGIKLDIFDLLNALLRPKDIHLKELWKVDANRFALGDNDKGKIFVLQTMSMIKQDYCAPKFLYFLVPGAKKKTRLKDSTFKDVVLINSKEEFDDLWKKALEKNLESLKMISNSKDFGAITPKLIPYPTMLPIFTALNLEKINAKYTDKKSVEEKIRAWYWASVFTKNYSGSVETKMAQELREMRKWFTDDKKVPRVVKIFKQVLESPDFLHKLVPGSAIYKGVLCLLAKRGALDFYSWQLPEYAQLDDHHIVPQSWGKRNCPDEIDSIFNRTLISNSTNRNIINDKLPNAYILEMVKKNRKGIGDVYKLFETHLVPKEAVDILLRKNFTKDDFDEYLAIRERAIKDQIAKIIKDIPIDDSDIEADIEEEIVDGESIGDDNEQLSNTLIFCESGSASARAYPGRGNHIRVLKGSIVSPKITETFQRHNGNYKRMRDSLIADKTIDSVDGKLIFTKDCNFTSPSGAAAVIFGRSADGPSVWKTETGKTLYDLKEEIKSKRLEEHED